MSGPAKLLEIEGLDLSVPAPGAPLGILHDVSISVAAGETLCVVGESGCGKSMTALAAMGLQPRGAIRSARRMAFEGRDLQTMSARAMDDLRGDRMSMIFQDPSTAFNPSFTVGNQLEEVWLRHRTGSRAMARERALMLLERVGIASASRRLRQFPHQLSGGLRQRAMIAMALMCEPRLLIADEPTTALDVTIQAQVLRLMRELQDEMGLGILLITHDIGVVAAMATRIAVMYAGEVVETGPAGEVLRNPKHPYTRGLLACYPRLGGGRRKLGIIPGSVPAPGGDNDKCRFASRCFAAVDECRSRSIAPTPLDAGRLVRCIRPDAQRGEEPIEVRAEPVTTSESGVPLVPVLEISGLERTFSIGGGFLSKAATLHALRGVALRLYRNQTVAIVGESGCGKSTLARIALGLLEPSGGQIYVDGEPIAQMRRTDIARKMQPVFQDPYSSLAPHRTILDAICVPLDVQREGKSAGRKSRALSMMERVGLPDHFADRRPAELSGGQRQRVAIARALVLEPQILVCDEPTSALDVSVQAQILNLLAELKARLGLALLLITHNFAVVEQLADRVAVMYLGRIVEEGPCADMLERPRHPYTRLLLSSNLNPELPGGGLTPERDDSASPDPSAPSAGCAFEPRCPNRSDICRRVSPAELPAGLGFVACHHPFSPSTP